MGSFQENDLPIKSTFASIRQLRQFNNYELTMMTLKGETFGGFKIVGFVIDVSSVILSMCIGLMDSVGSK